MTASSENREAQKTKQRFEQQLGKRRLAEKIAAITGYSQAAVFRWYNEGFPDAAIIVLALLESMPSDQWPKEVETKLASFS